MEMREYEGEKGTLRCLIQVQGRSWGAPGECEFGVHMMKMYCLHE